MNILIHSLGIFLEGLRVALAMIAAALLDVD
jgi:hypothetical protein